MRSPPSCKERTATVVDANGSETRQQYGVIPGAVLLTNHREFALSELPAAKSNKLVFYCGGTMCRASDKAASRAVAAGYTRRQRLARRHQRLEGRRPTDRHAPQLIKTTASVER